MKHELISVIMPAYNTADYIAEAIESVIGQTYKSFELIVIDDGSSDNTRDVVDKYACRDKRVIYVHQENKGVSAARNKGIELSRGEYVSFLDSDDTWDKDFLYKMHGHISTNLHDCVYCRYATISGTKVAYEDDKGRLPSGQFEAFIIKPNIFGVTFCVGSLLTKKAILDKYGINFDTSIAISEDIGFYLKLLSITSIYPLNETLMFYRQRNDSATHKEWLPDKWEGEVLIYGQAEPYMKRYCPDKADMFYKLWQYRAYKFVLKTVRECSTKEALHYIDKHRDALKQFAQTGYKLNDRIKCRMIMTKNPAILKIIKKYF